MIIDREQWIKEAEKAEKSGGVVTCQALVSNTIAMGIEPEDQKKTWMEDAEGVCIIIAVYYCWLLLFTIIVSIWYLLFTFLF